MGLKKPIEDNSFLVDNEHYLLPRVDTIFDIV